MYGLDEVRRASQPYHAALQDLTILRFRLRQSIVAARQGGASLGKIANAAGLTREGVRYILGKEEPS
jgi:hypothetical protein